MDSEFINAFIAKQKALIDDFQARYLILETKYDLAVRELDRIKAENESKKSAVKESK